MGLRSGLRTFPPPPSCPLNTFSWLGMDSCQECLPSALSSTYTAGDTRCQVSPCSSLLPGLPTCDLLLPNVPWSGARFSLHWVPPEPGVTRRISVPWCLLSPDITRLVSPGLVVPVPPPLATCSPPLASAGAAPQRPAHVAHGHLTLALLRPPARCPLAVFLRAPSGVGIYLPSCIKIRGLLW